MIDRGYPQTMIKNKVHREGVCTPETQQQRGKKILPFVTQYQPSVSTLTQKFYGKNGILLKTNRFFAKFLKNQEERKIPKGHAR